MGAKRAREARAELGYTRDGPLPDLLEAECVAGAAKCEQRNECGTCCLSSTLTRLAGGLRREPDSAFSMTQCPVLLQRARSYEVGRKSDARTSNDSAGSARDRDLRAILTRWPS